MQIYTFCMCCVTHYVALQSYPYKPKKEQVLKDMLPFFEDKDQMILTSIWSQVPWTFDELFDTGAPFSVVHMKLAKGKSGKHIHLHVRRRNA